MGQIVYLQLTLHTPTPPPSPPTHTHTHTSSLCQCYFIKFTMSQVHTVIDWFNIILPRKKGVANRWVMLHICLANLKHKPMIYKAATLTDHPTHRSRWNCLVTISMLHDLLTWQRNTTLIKTLTKTPNQLLPWDLTELNLNTWSFPRRLSNILVI